MTDVNVQQGVGAASLIIAVASFIAFVLCVVFVFAPRWKARERFWLSVAAFVLVLVFAAGVGVAAAVL